MTGYVWGLSDRRIEIPITNERELQTYFGALNYQTQQFTFKVIHRARENQRSNLLNIYNINIKVGELS
jgi:hypothetical protein